MLLLVLRSLLVYLGTAALLLLLAHRYVVRLRLLPALLLALAPLLFTGKAVLTGGVFAPLDIAYHSEPLASLRAERGIGRTPNPLSVDVVSQMIPWRQAVREAISHGRLPLWNPHVLAGEPLLGVAQPAVLHPGTWVGLLLPLPQAWTFDMTLRLFLAAASAYLCLRGLGSSELASLLATAAWTFSDFLVFFVGYPVTPSVAPFPLLLLALHRLARDADRRAVALTVVALSASIVSGHPETLLFVVFGGGLFFLYELWQAGRGRRLRPILLSLAAGALALGLTAVALLPFVDALPQTLQHALRRWYHANYSHSEAPIEAARRVVTYGALGRSEYIGRLIKPAGYAGALLFPLAGAGLTAPGRRRWLWLAMGVLGLALHARAPAITDSVAALPLFDIAVPDYLVFLWVFALAALAAMGLDRLRAGHASSRRAFFAAAAASTSAIVLAAALRAAPLRVLGMSAVYFRLRVLLEVVPIFAGAALVAASARRWGRLTAASAAGLLLLLIGARRWEEAEVYPTYPASAFYPPLPLLDPIPRGVPERFAALRWTFEPNAAAMYGLEDVRGYDAMTFQPLAETFGLWCEQIPAFYNRVDRATPFLSLLNVRWALVPAALPAPEGWIERGAGNGLRLLENPAALPRAFAPRNLAWTADGAEQIRILATISDYENDGVAGRTLDSPLRWRDNGPARVEVVSYAPERLAMSVDADAPSLVGTSIPAWRGWRLAIDGRDAPLTRFDHAFVGFEVPAGRHEAVLRYFPASFAWGAGISAATVLLCLGIAIRSRRWLRSTRPR
jgi:hypothetical protein